MIRVRSLSLISLLFAQIAFADPLCTRLLAPEESAFARIVHQKDSQFYLSKDVVAEQDRLVRRGLSRATQPANQIFSFFDALEKIQQRALIDGWVKERLRSSYYDRYVIKSEDIPEAYFDNQRRLARERGNGNVELTQAMRNEMVQILTLDQQRSLDIWFDFLLSEEASAYPFYLKYWSFTSMLRLGKFDIETGRFTKRTRNTVAPFPELNAEALAKLLDQLPVVLRRDTPLFTEMDPELRALLAQADFPRLYARELTKFHQETLDIAKSGSGIEGTWVKYNQGSNADPLVRSLEGKNTGWCTANAATARSQLQRGDFHVFYTRNTRGEMNHPRVAIRMEGDEIAEMRGIAKDQNIDSVIGASSVVEDKLKTFGPKADRFKKKDADMRRLTELEKSNQTGKLLTSDDLRFLYEIDAPIETFGHNRDPRIDEILSGRDQRKDLAIALSLSEKEISLTDEEFFQPGIKFHFGNLTMSLKDGILPKFPERIHGNLIIEGIVSADNFELPKIVRGAITIYTLETAENIIVPAEASSVSFIHLKNVKNLQFRSKVPNVELNYLADAKGVHFPEVDRLQLASLKSAEGVVFPDSLKRLEINAIEDARGLILPPHLTDLSMFWLARAEGLVLPSSIIHLQLGSLKDVEGLHLPNHLTNLYLHNLTNAKGLILPDSLRHLQLEALKKTDGLKLPSHLDHLNLDGLENGDGLKIPSSVTILSLNGITKLDDFELPPHLVSLCMRNLKKIKTLNLPDSLTALIFEKLESVETLVLPSKINFVSLHSLRSASGVTFPAEVSHVQLGIIDTKGLKLPAKVNSLNLDNLTHISNLKIPNGLKVLSLNGLTDLQGLKLPPDLQHLNLNGLKDTKGLELPISLNGLSLNSLKKGFGLRIPDSVTRLLLNGLIDASNLRLPHSLKELNLDQLEDLSGLELPDQLETISLQRRNDILGLKIPASLKHIHLQRGS